MKPLFAGLLLVAFSGCNDGASSPPSSPESAPTFTTDAPLRLRLTANDDGSLKQMTLNQTEFGNDSKAFKRLAKTAVEIAKSGDAEDANPAQVFITADRHMRFEAVYNAIHECAGRHEKQKQTQTQHWISRINDIRLMMPGPNGEVTVPRGSFIYVPGGEYNPDDIELPDIHVRLTANEDGSLKMLYLLRTEMGNDERAFQQLNDQILRIIGRPGNPLTQDIAVSINSDPELQYRFVVQAMEACHGRVDSQGKQWVMLVKNIGFVGIGFAPADTASTNNSD